MPVYAPETYAIHLGTGTGTGTNPNDASTYYFGLSAGWGNASTNQGASTLGLHVWYQVLKPGRIVAAGGSMRRGGAETPSTHRSEFRILRVDAAGSTSSVIVSSNVSATGGFNDYVNTSLNFPVRLGDRLLMAFVTPTWSTNPTATFYNTTLLVEVP